MAKGKAPAFMLYCGDWLSSTTILLMTPAEEGAYIRLLCHAWMALDCGLPAGDEELSVLSRLGAEWTKSAPKIRANFYEREGRIFNERLLKERANLDEWKRKSSEGGKLSAEMRAKAQIKGGSRVVEKCLPVGCAMVEEKTQPNVNTRVEVEVLLEEVDFDSKKKEGAVFAKRPNAREGAETVKAFSRWWTRWSEVTRRAVGESDAAQAWLSMVYPENEPAAFECLESYLASGEVTAGKVRNPAKFLYEEGRNDWKSRWPTPAIAAIPRKLSLAEQLIAEIKEKEAANGTR